MIKPELIDQAQAEYLERLRKVLQHIDQLEATLDTLDAQLEKNME
jgi:hypothetical protein